MLTCKQKTTHTDFWCVNDERGRKVADFYGDLAKVNAQAYCEFMNKSVHGTQELRVV
jgi:hypothetical protein